MQFHQRTRKIVYAIFTVLPENCLDIYPGAGSDVYQSSKELPMSYIQRDAESKLRNYLDNNRALFILGARQVGKTSLLKRLAEIVGKDISVILDLENPEHLHGLGRDLNSALKYLEQQSPAIPGRVWIFIDEIQYVDDLSPTVKYIVDHHSDRYKLVMTGSSSLLIKKSFSESLVGRKDIVELYPLSFSEYCRFQGEEKMATMLTGVSPDQYHGLGIPESKLRRFVGDYIVYGAYPQVTLTSNREVRIELLRDVVSSYILKDIKQLFKIEKIDQFNQLIRYLSVNIGKELNIRAVSKLVSLHWDTVQKHVQALREAYVIAQIKPFHSNLNTEIRKMSKVYFVDTGVRNAIINNFNPIELHADRGELYENFVYQQLFYQKTLLSEIRFWKTRNGQEIDFVVNDEGILTAYEVKFGAGNKNHFDAFGTAYPDADCRFVRF